MYTLLEQLKALPIQRGKVNHVSILHDDDCPALRSGRMSDCRCQPEVVMGKPEKIERQGGEHA